MTDWSGPGRRRGPTGVPAESGCSEHVRDLDDARRETPDELESTLDHIVGRGTAPTRSDVTADGLRQRIAADPDTVERDLVKLVLTVVELVRQLMERQALRRIDQGDLSEEQEERIGMTLMLLEERMTELRDRYGLSTADLNLDLGPLGSLLPESDGLP